MPPKIYHFINTLNFWSLRSLECQMSILGQLVQRFYLPKLWLWSSANFSTNAKSTAWYFSIFIPMALFFKETVVAEFSSSAIRPSVTYFFFKFSPTTISAALFIILILSWSITASFNANVCKGSHFCHSLNIAIKVFTSKEALFSSSVLLFKKSKVFSHTSAGI